MQCRRRQTKIGLCNQGPHESTNYGVIKIKYILTILGQFLSTTCNLRNPLAVQHHINRQYSSFCYPYFESAVWRIVFYSGGRQLNTLCRAKANFNETPCRFLIHVTPSGRYLQLHHDLFLSYLSKSFDSFTINLPTDFVNSELFIASWNQEKSNSKYLKHIE
jgi:hypothetical protein